MDVLYDYQTFINQRFGGISRYFAELMTRLPQGYEAHNPVVLSSNIYLKSVPGMEFATMWWPRFMKKYKKAHKINKFISRRVLRDGNYDIFHPTYYDPYFLDSVRRPYVITVHDLIYEKYPEMFPINDRTAENMRLTIKNASRIIAISHNTKRDLMELYGLSGDNIDIVYQGYGLDNSRVEQIPGLPGRFILYVGGRFGYKNFTNFCEAFSIIRAKYPDVELVCTGTPFDADEQALLNRLGIAGCTRSIFVSEPQLTWLYRHALCFVYPSLYEGFGIPILEAYACGCPVVLSDASCFPEVAGDGGHYFDPQRPESIAASIGEVLDDPDLRKRMMTLGSEIVKSFSWKRVADETAEVYARTLS
ncbi:MAG: glycosyltransferase family 4 protein [Duncaniella sp.]|nr:glycosyltransferase family 4 protein [Duncaniella sp.]